jgi:hypothetical protein
MMPKSYLIRVTSARKKCWSRAIFPAGAAQVFRGTTRFGSLGRCFRGDRKREQLIAVSAVSLRPLLFNIGETIGSLCLKS